MFYMPPDIVIFYVVFLLPDFYISLFLILNGLLVNDVVNISVNNAGLWRRKKEDSANEEGSHTICVFIAFFYIYFQTITAQ